MSDKNLAGTRAPVKTRPLPGGIHPPENKAQSLALPLGEVPLPEQLVLPLRQHIGAPAEAIVKAGDRVLAGQMIAAARGLVSAPVHAPASGEVVALEKRPVAHPSGFEDDCIVIRTDGRDEWIALDPCEDYTALERERVLEKIRNAGIAGLGGAGFPAAVKLTPRANRVIDTLIVNGAECEPYITADDRLMRTRAGEIIAGTRMLAHLLGGPERILIGIEDNKPEAIAAMTTAAAGTDIDVVGFPTRYPSGGEKQLIQILTGREVPHGKLPADIGIVCQNVGSVHAAWRAVRFGEPLVSRVTTVVGEALRTQRNIVALLGTPIEHILRHHGFDPQRCSRLVMGGPMMGFTLNTAAVPVVKTTNCILAPSRAELPPPPPAQACIRCGMCAQACPVGLLPQQLYWYARAQDADKLEAHNLFDCIECGACAYVCPSNIPLVQYYRASKGRIRQLEADKERADRSRQRFEFHQRRIDRAEAEKEARRQARKKAAQQAKERQAQARPGENAPPPANPDPVAEAMARVKAQRNSPEQQIARLERALTSAENRLRTIRQQLADAEVQNSGASQTLEKLRAREKEAEVKLKEAQQKLAAFDAPLAPNVVAAGGDPAAAPGTVATAGDTVAASDTVAAADNPIATSGAVAANGNTVAESDAVATADNPVATPNSVATAGDPVAAAIARAQAKMSMSPAEKLQANIETLRQRLEKARARLEKAEREGDDNIGALRTGVDKLRTKLAQAREQLNSAAGD